MTTSNILIITGTAVAVLTYMIKYAFAYIHETYEKVPAQNRSRLIRLLETIRRYVANDVTMKG